MNQTDIMNYSGVTQTKRFKTIVLNKKKESFPVYRVPLKYLYYNNQNDRVSTDVIRYTSEKGREIPTNRDEYNDLFEELVFKSKEDATIKTQRSIATRGQDNPGVTLEDGRVVDGNRRFTCLRRIQRETNQEQFFDTIILDYNYEDDYKYIKSLELELQMGIEEKVKYDPVDRLYGVYNSIRIQKAFTVEEYAALFDDYSVSEVKSDLALADLMCEYLEFQGSPGKFYIAKDMNLEGTLHEIPAVIERIRKKNPELVDDFKNRIFSFIAIGADARLNLFIRDLKAIIDDGDYRKLLKDTEKPVQEIIEILDENPVKSYNDLADNLRSREDIKEELVAPVNAQKRAIESKKLKKAPVKLLRDALANLESIQLDSIPEMTDEDIKELRDLIEKIEIKIGDIREKI